MKKLFFLFLFTVAIYPQSLLYAAGPSTPSALGSATTNNIGKRTIYSSDSVTALFIGLVNWFAWFVALMSVTAALYSGFLFITSGDDEKKLGKATKFFVYTIVGVIVAILAFSIVAIAKSIVGI
ncbi:MAG: hypothetical protein AAB614_00520 [Patescibacteria group bacterium]